MNPESTSPIDWSTVDTVLLDMDGTILDLAFDNYFWTELLPRRYSAQHGVSLPQARARLTQKMASIQHTLPWYCLDHWTEQTGLDLAALKAEVRSRIAPLQGAVEFLRQVRASGRALWLVTNAHRDSWTLKLRQTGLTDCFDRHVCSHDHGAAKEDDRFWSRLQQAYPFERSRVLFADDSLPVLAAARRHGIGQLLAIAQPDSAQPARPIDGYPSVRGLRELLPLPAGRVAG